MKTCPSPDWLRELGGEYFKWHYILRSSAKCDLALSALREWHYLLIALALKYELALSALREWTYILVALVRYKY